MSTGTDTLRALREHEVAPWTELEIPNGNPRCEELRRVLEEVRCTEAGGSDATLDSIAMLLVDAVLDQDEATLATGLEELQRLWAARRRTAEGAAAEECGMLAALVGVARWSLERTPPVDLLDGLVRAGSHAFRMLEAIEDQPGISNTDLRLRLGVSETEVSRCGRRLIDGSLATKRQVGKRNAWTLTPRGRQVVLAASADADRTERVDRARAAVDRLMANPQDTADAAVAARRRVAEAPRR